MQLTFWPDRCDYEYMSSGSHRMGPGVREGGAEKEACYCCDDNNPSIQLMVCHPRGSSALEDVLNMSHIEIIEPLLAGDRYTVGARPHRFIIMRGKKKK